MYLYQWVYEIFWSVLVWNEILVTSTKHFSLQDPDSWPWIWKCKIILRIKPPCKTLYISVCRTILVSQLHISSNKRWFDFSKCSVSRVQLISRMIVWIQSWDIKKWVIFWSLEFVVFDQHYLFKYSNNLKTLKLPYPGNFD